MIKLKLPWPPSVNAYLKPVNNRLIKSARSREYVREVGRWLKFQRYTKPVIGNDVVLDITLYPPTRRSFDVDNRLKALLDALQQTFVIGDDKQVIELTVRKAEVRTNGEAIVQIKEHKTC